ncbi:hypothetical protein BDR03DRAFT_1018109 [Suillus americanus]|nr:hypothetical protein BDR03DRAFT_1018109 [Suillus americanus]
MNTLSENVTESQTPSTPTASDVTLSEESSVSIDYFSIIDEIESNSLFESTLTSAEYANKNKEHRGILDIVEALDATVWIVSLLNRNYMRSSSADETSSDEPDKPAPKGRYNP